MTLFEVSHLLPHVASLGFGVRVAGDLFDVGTVVSIGDGIARVYGCEACLAGELLEFADGSLGLALNLESQTVGAVRFASSFGTRLGMPLVT
jgi:F0F1-type ATP synthase alpha subunit